MRARGTAGLAPLALLLAVVLAPAAAHAGAREGRDRVLPGCGICYPGGYDVNTVGDVPGKVVDFQEPAEGPVRFVLAGERERWVVLAAPAWFWKRAQSGLVAGDAVIVRGSKTLGADGTLYLIAQEMRVPGAAAAVVLRDRHGAPCWSGSRCGTAGGPSAVLPPAPPRAAP